MVAEVWAGLRAVSGIFGSNHGYSVGAICELERKLLQIGAHRHPSALVQGDFYRLDWAQWKRALGRVDVLTGSLSCVTLSSAGRMKILVVAIGNGPIFFADLLLSIAYR